MSVRIHKENLSINATQSDVERAIGWADIAINQQNTPAPLKSRVAVALDDILTNIVSYGFDHNATSHIDLELAFGTDTLTLTIADNGKCFDPTAAPKPEKYHDIEDVKIGGMGIAFVRKMTSSMHYRRQDGLNILTLTFDFPVDEM
jgi:anti-sigma regulatory factor (Ser/Thr protein kinase)